MSAGRECDWVRTGVRQPCLGAWSVLTPVWPPLQASGSVSVLGNNCTDFLGLSWEFELRSCVQSSWLCEKHGPSTTAGSFSSGQPLGLSYRQGQLGLGHLFSDRLTAAELGEEAILKDLLSTAWLPSTGCQPSLLPSRTWASMVCVEKW